MGQARLAWATLVGVILGVAYVASPLTLWCLAAIGGLIAWAGRGLMPRERRWVWGLLLAAAAMRLLVIAVLALGSDFHTVCDEVDSLSHCTHTISVPGSFPWDGDGVYLKQRASWLRDAWMGLPLSAHHFDLAIQRIYGWTSYLYIIAYLQYLLGPSPYAVHLFNTVLFLAAVVTLYRVVRPGYGRASSLLGFAIILFMPTPFLWSISALKESLVLLMVAMGVAAIVIIVRAQGILKRMMGVLLLSGLTATIGTVRSAGLLILLGGLGVGVAGRVIIRRTLFAAVAMSLVLYAGYRADVPARIMSTITASAVLHIGNVRTPGHHYKLLDQRFYDLSFGSPVVMASTSDFQNPMTPVEALRFTVRSFASFVLTPLPWQLQSTLHMLFLPQQIIWYVLVFLAVIGLVAGLRRDPLLTCLLAGITAVGATVVSPISGNIGTMIRHRDMVVPFLVWLSAVGAVATASAWMARVAEVRKQHALD